MTEDKLQLTCQDCGCHYEKTADYLDWQKEYPNDLHIKWSLAYCDPCRRAKEMQVLKNMPAVLQAILDTSNEKDL